MEPQQTNKRMMDPVQVPVHGVDDGSVLFSVFKAPVPMPRPRWSFAPGRGGRGGRPYNPASKVMKEWKGIVKGLLFGEENKNKPPIFLRDQSVEVFCAFRFKRPTSHYKANGKLRTDAPSRPDSCGDTDNYIKYIQDVMNKLVYDDDVQIVSVWGTKAYREEASVTVQVRPIYLR
jgi:Holliday junction resolvase RusA-like endonuclease